MDFPLTEEAHWVILRDNATSKAEKQTVDRISELFGFEVDGEVVEINRDSFGVGFELTAPDISTGRQNLDVFPTYHESRPSMSYKCTATKLNGRFYDMAFEEFSEQEFRHVFRVCAPVYHKFLSDLEKKGMYIREINDVNGYKELETTTEYVEEIQEKKEDTQIS